MEAEPGVTKKDWIAKKEHIDYSTHAVVSDVWCDGSGHVVGLKDEEEPTDKLHLVYAPLPVGKGGIEHPSTADWGQFVCHDLRNIAQCLPGCEPGPAKGDVDCEETHRAQGNGVRGG